VGKKQDSARRFVEQSRKEGKEANKDWDSPPIQSQLQRNIYVQSLSYFSFLCDDASMMNIMLMIHIASILALVYMTV
jgi:hypothetical protein